ncbi:hypothetical protein LGQ03_13355 [Loktanella sp. TSTF-M6]|uniref:Uncharacterized protein n=1 Tax=Loktanella gaetbuli TaxID=2881335 RepID=A0ABS8BWV8_9RHOB|nr:hypothetical protein [Loktanella gaetbuli]MCB5200232.1 hypothetical protein [Loktanella gaetbuli]
MVVASVVPCMVDSNSSLSKCGVIAMIKMKDLNSGFSYRSAWTGYAKGRGIDIENAPILHSARIDSNQIYDDPFKGPRHKFSKKYEQFITALKASEYAIIRHGGKDENQALFGSGKLIAIYGVSSYEIDENGGVKIQLGDRLAF